MGGPRINVRLSAASKPSGGQKKPLDAHAFSPLLPSKKQKVAGDFSNQSIEHFNDIIAISGVNLSEEEEQLFSGSKDDNRVSEASHKAVQEEEHRLILQKIPLQKKIAEIMTKYGLENLGDDVEQCLSLCVEERLCGLIDRLVRVSKQRVDYEKSMHNFVVMSNVREQILAINQKAKEEPETKEAKAEKLLKHNEHNSLGGVDVVKKKDKGRGKALKVNKEAEKWHITAANVAARAAVGGNDMLSKWKLMAQKHQNHDWRTEGASSSQSGKDGNCKSWGTLAANVGDVCGTSKKEQSASSAPGMWRRFCQSQAGWAPPRVAHRISMKDLIAVLEREPRMAKSTIIYRLYESLGTDDAAPLPLSSPASAPE